MFVKCISRKKQNLPIYPQKAGCTYIMKATNRDPIIISHRFMMNKSLPFSPTSLFQEHHWHRFCPGLTQLAFKCSLLYGFPLLYFPANVRNLCIFSVKKECFNKGIFCLFRLFVLCFVNQFIYVKGFVLALHF